MSAYYLNQNGEIDDFGFSNERSRKNLIEYTNPGLNVLFAGWMQNNGLDKRLSDKINQILLNQAINNSVLNIAMTNISSWLREQSIIEPGGHLILESYEPAVSLKQDTIDKSAIKSFIFLVPVKR